VLTSAPGRVNLIGEHTDYNGGQVLPIAIAQRTWVAVRRTSSAEGRAVSAAFDGPGKWEADSPKRTGEWWDYVSGVTRAFAIRGTPVGPVEIAVASDVPAGAGLSSSAAVEVAAAMAVATLVRAEVSRLDCALLGHEVETQFVGVASGIMDQFASALSEKAHALHLYCDTEEFEQVPMSQAVLIFDTAVPRSLRNSDFNRRQTECARALELLRSKKPELDSLAAATPDDVREANLPAPLDKRAMHVSTETRRVEQAVAALRVTGTIPGALLYESHESLRALYECSTPELDWFVQRASSAPGVHGARLTGAGWGGCAIAVGDTDGLEDLAYTIIDDYRSRFGLTGRTLVTHAAEGARVETISA
jgi:galactokinase